MQKIKRARQEPDLLQGSIADKLLLIALPLAATGILQQLFNAADIAVVGRFVGENAMAAVGSDTPVVNLIVNFFVGISLGTNVIISQFIGQKNHDGIRKAVQTSVLFALGGGLVFCVIAELLTNRLLSMLSVPQDVLGMATAYLRIYFLGLPIIFLYNFEAAIFRAEGDTRTPLLILTASGALNVVLNLVFVLGFGMDVNGVALATLLSNLLSAALLFVLLCRGRGDVHLNIHALHFDAGVLKRILMVGIPAGIQSAVFSLANICIQAAVNSLGATVMAASSAAFNLEIFSYYIVNAFAQAGTTFVGQNYGAGNLARCRKTLRITLVMDALFSAAACALILVFVKPLLAVFNENPTVIELGIIRVDYIFISYIFTMLVDVFSGYMRGFGESLAPAVVSLICIVGTRLLWVYFVFPQYRTFANLMLVYPISTLVTSVVIVACWLVMRVRRGF